MQMQRLKSSSFVVALNGKSENLCPDGPEAICHFRSSVSSLEVVQMKNASHKNMSARVYHWGEKVKRECKVY